MRFCSLCVPHDESIWECLVVYWDHAADAILLALECAQSFTIGGAREGCIHFFVETLQGRLFWSSYEELAPSVEMRIFLSFPEG
jgi:hypothetical protein